MSTTDLTAAPKALRTLKADAEAVGYTTKVDYFEGVAGQQFWSLSVTHDTREAEVFVHWSTKNVAGLNSRLGFATDYKPGMRFDYATGRDYAGRHVSPTSVRQARFALGLPI